MTKTNELLRKPRPPKLHRIDLSTIGNITPVQTLLNESDSSGSHTPSVEKEFLAPSHISETKTTTTNLPILTPKNTQLAIRSHLERYEKSLHSSAVNYHEHEFADRYFRARTETKTIFYDEEEDKNAFNFKALSRTTYKRLLSLSPEKRIQSSNTVFKSVDRHKLDKIGMVREYSQFKNPKNSLLKPFKPLGPDPLPQRQPKQFLDKRKNFENLTYNEDAKQNVFTLNDFILDRDEDMIDPLEKTKFIQSILSTKHYKGFCKALEEKIRLEQNKNSDKVHVHTLEPDLEPFEHRVPLRQLIIEMASYLKKELSEKMGVNLKAKLNQLPKWQNSQGAHTEIVVYEDENEKNNSKQNTISQDDPESQITVTHLAIVDSLLKNGLVLNLKAHFIDTLPDLSALEKTLIYVNLSFNNFEEFPNELLNVPKLEAIKLRNNPLKSLPLELNQLVNLKILVLSFCQLDKEIPTCVFMLPNLRHLDVSYNSITHISKHIVDLNNLKNFNCEGNEIYYLPCSMLNMTNLKQINVKNNYLHPMLWKTAMKNNPQTLFDLSALKVLKYYKYYKNIKNTIGSEIEYFLQNPKSCDCCGKARFGDGLKLIKPCTKIFGVKYLPFMFKVCSPECLNQYRREESFKYEI